ncbi:MAG: VacJ family lipoprotein [Sphingomonas sp.]|jgi:phospholipid-binding lipoprotein MlaA
MSVAAFVAAAMICGPLAGLHGLDPAGIVAAMSAKGAGPAPQLLPLLAAPAAPDTAGGVNQWAQTGEQATKSDPQAAGHGEPPQGDIVVTARQPLPGDPLARINAKTYAITQAVDAAIVRPTALAFARVVPAPVRDGLGNFLRNLREPDIFINFVLQHKVGKALKTVARFVVNSTIGIGGLFDIAKKRPFKLPFRTNGFADTMGFYGVKPGPYLYLPIIGPTTVRDIFGAGLDRLVVPLAFGKPFDQPYYSLPTSAASTLDHRAAFDDELQQRREESADPYVARRNLYLATRQSEIDALHTRRSSARPPAHTPASPVAPIVAPPAKPDPLPKLPF